MRTLCIRRPYSTAHVSSATRSISSLTRSMPRLVHSLTLSSGASSAQPRDTAFPPSSSSAPMRGASAFRSARSACILQETWTCQVLRSTRILTVRLT